MDDEFDIMQQCDNITPFQARDVFMDPAFIKENTPSNQPSLPLNREDKLWIKNSSESNVLTTLPSPAVQSYLAKKLDKYKQPIPDSQEAWQNFVLTKYLELIEEPLQDPKIIKSALDSLAKTTVVNLFVERKEISITNESTENLEEELKKYLDKYLGEPIEGEIVK